VACTRQQLRLFRPEGVRAVGVGGTPVKPVAPKMVTSVLRAAAMMLLGKKAGSDLGQISPSVNRQRRVSCWLYQSFFYSTSIVWSV
jgi:hypothetical protein